MLALYSDMMITFVFFCLTCTCLSSVSITGNNVIIILVETTHSWGGVWEQTVQRNAYSRYPHTYSTLDFCHGMVYTMQKPFETRRHCEEWQHATIFRNPPKLRWREQVGEDCYMWSLLLAVASCFKSFWHGIKPSLHPTSFLYSFHYFLGCTFIVA